MTSPFSSATFKNIERRTDLSNRIDQRRFPQNLLPMTFQPRPVQTKRVLMPLNDLEKGSAIQIAARNFNVRRDFIASDLAPFKGYAAEIDTETKLHNTIFPLQKGGAQQHFIPGTTSDLFNADYLTHNNMATSIISGGQQKILFDNEKVGPYHPKYPERVQENTAGMLFYNHTRQQLKNLNL